MSSFVEGTLTFMTEDEEEWTVICYELSKKLHAAETSDGAGISFAIGRNDDPVGIISAYSTKHPYVKFHLHVFMHGGCSYTSVDYDIEDGVSGQAGEIVDGIVDEGEPPAPRPTMKATSENPEFDFSMLA